MDILTPPTDNLYKFMALSGVLLVISCFFLSNKALDTLADKVDSLEEAWEIDSIKTKYLDNIVDHRLRDKMTERAGLREIGFDLKKQALELRIETARVAAKTKSIRRLLNAVSRQMLLYAIGSGVGGFLGYFGFRLWYC